MIRNLIREFILQEEVFGAQAFVYHGSKVDPTDLIPAFLNNQFIPGGGDYYGKGLYAVYDLESGRTGSGFYGPFIYKLKVNLYGFISFDPDVTKLIYKRDLEPWQQAEEVGADTSIVEALKIQLKIKEDEMTSLIAKEASAFLKGHVKGLVYTGKNDGRCVVVYDASVVAPIAWKDVRSSTWHQVKKERIKPALRRSSTGEWEKEKYETSLLSKLKKMEKLPIDQRIFEGDLNLTDSGISSLPDGLKVKGDLDLTRCPIKSLPSGLEVSQKLTLTNSLIISLPSDIKIGKSLNMSETRITSLPDGLVIDGMLDAEWSYLSSLPRGLVVRRLLIVSHTRVSSIPIDLKVGKIIYMDYCDNVFFPKNFKTTASISLIHSKISRLPDGLVVGGYLDISNTEIRSLPSGLTIGDYLGLEQCPVKVLPEDLQVEGEIFGFEGHSYPSHLQSKFQNY